MTLRLAQTQDAPAITALWNALIRDTLSTFTTVEKLFTETEVMIAQRAKTFWVIEEGGTVQGFATYGSFRGGPGYAATVEHTVILDARAQGEGHGRALMRQAMATAAAQGHHIMIAGISGANPGAVAFHAALGFTQTAHMPEVGRKQGQWLDLILMQKTLTPS